MKNYLKGTCLLLILGLSLPQAAEAQGSLLKKIRDRAEDEVVKGIFGDKEKSPDQGSRNEPGSRPAGSESNVSNTRGGGLTNTPPNVPENIADAGSAFSSQEYSAARYAVRQAILGIEMEIGQEILKEMPSSVKGLQPVPEEDHVTSTSIGFVGLTIVRVYRGNDQELKITVGNNSAMLSAVKMYMSSSYSSSTDQNYKQVKFKGYPGILEYDDYAGYTLSVPFGQSSIFVAGGKNFADENEIMAAAEEFELEKIKDQLGEQ